MKFQGDLEHPLPQAHLGDLETEQGGLEIGWGIRGKGVETPPLPLS